MELIRIFSCLQFATHNPPPPPFLSSQTNIAQSYCYVIVVITFPQTQNVDKKKCFVNDKKRLIVKVNVTLPFPLPLAPPNDAK